MVRAGITIDLQRGKYIIPNELPVDLRDRCHSCKFQVGIQHISPESKVVNNNSQNIDLVMANNVLLDDPIFLNIIILGILTIFTVMEWFWKAPNLIMPFFKDLEASNDDITITQPFDI